MPTPIERSLAAIRQAEQLQQDILAAISGGDRETAERLSVEHHRIIESIPFGELPEALPAELTDALQRLQSGNAHLMTITAEIQAEIGKQLAGVQKGKQGSQVYSTIDKHQ